MTNKCNVIDCWKDATEYISYSGSLGTGGRKYIEVDARYCEPHFAEYLKKIVERI